MNIQLIDQEIVSLVSRLTSSKLTLIDLTPDIVFTCNLLLVLTGVAYADGEVSASEKKFISQSLNSLNLTSESEKNLAKTLLRQIQAQELCKNAETTEKFLAVLVKPLSLPERILLFGIACKVSFADNLLDLAELNLLREFARVLQLPNSYEQAIIEKICYQESERNNLQEISNLLNPARFRGLGLGIINLASDLSDLMKEGISSNYTETIKSLEMEAPSAEDKIINPEMQPISQVVQEVSSSQSLPSNASPLKSLEMQKQLLVSRIRQCSEQINVCIDDKLLPSFFGDKIRELKQRVESQRFRVAVIGEFSQGKSTLLNALVGERIQPVRAIPCSGTISVLKYGRTKKVICCYKDGSQKEIPLEQYASCVSIAKDAALNNRENVLADSNIGEVVFEHPHLEICKNGVEILDSPGLNEHPDRTTITRKLLVDTDAIIFMTNANKVLPQSEIQILEELQCLTASDSGRLKNVFVLVNFIDCIDNQDDLQDVKDRSNNILKNIISGKDRIHFISAREALNNCQDAKNKYVSDFNTFKMALENFLVQERGSLILERSSQELNVIIRDCSEQLRENLINLDVNLSSEIRQAIVETIGEITGRFIRIKKEKNLISAKTCDEAISSWRSYVTFLPKHLKESSESWETKHTIIFNRDGVMKDFCSSFQITIDRLLKTWFTTILSETILKPKLSLLERLIASELEEIKLSIQGNNDLSKLPFSNKLLSDLKFDTSYIGVFTAAGAGVGFGGGMAAFFLIPALAFGPALLIGGIAATAIATVAGLVSGTDAHNRAKELVCNSGIEKFMTAQPEIEENIKKIINDMFNQVLLKTDEQIQRLIREYENRLEQEDRNLKEVTQRRKDAIFNNINSFAKL